MFERKSKLVFIPFLAWLLIFIVVPLFLILCYSFTDANGHFTLQNFARMTQPLYLFILLRSLYLAFMATCICLVVGYPIALILMGDTFKHKAFFILLLISPMWMNFLLRTYAWLTLLENTGVVNHFLSLLGKPEPVQFLYNEYAVVLGMVYNFLPFMIFPIYTTVSRIEKHTIEAAHDLGASAFGVFYKIILPISIPGVLSGVTMVFVPSVTMFIISKLLGGNKISLIGDIIEQQFRVTNDWNFGSALSMIAMLIIMGLMWAVNRTAKDDAKVEMIW